MNYKLLSEVDTLSIRALAAECERDYLVWQSRLRDLIDTKRAAGLDPDSHDVVTSRGGRLPFGLVTDTRTGRPVETPDAPPEVPVGSLVADPGHKHEVPAAFAAPHVPGTMGLVAATPATHEGPDLSLVPEPEAAE